MRETDVTHGKGRSGAPFPVPQIGYEILRELLSTMAGGAS